jgi:hypothetical protein
MSLLLRKLIKFQVFYLEIEGKMCVVMYMGDSMFWNFIIKLRKEWKKKSTEWRRYEESAYSNSFIERLTVGRYIWSV